MPKNDLVSIIIPLYNGASFILETLDSCKYQSYTNIEVIVVDDNSRDQSAEIVKNYISSDSRFQYLYKENSGMTATRNYGYKFAKGEFVIFLDHDDKLETKYIENKLKLADNYDVIAANAKMFNNKGEMLGMASSIYSDVIEEVLTYTYGKITAPAAYMVRKQFIDTHRIQFKEYLSSIADKEFILELALNGARFAQDDSEDGILWYRSDETGFSYRLTEKLIDDNALFYDYLKEENHINYHDLKRYLLRGYAILYKSYFKVGNYRKFALYLIKYIFS